MRLTKPAALSLAASIALTASAHSQPAAVLKFWNLESATITALYLAAPGTAHWSANLCLTDPDRAVDPDERLAMPGVKSGTYDVRVVDMNKRECVFHGAVLKPTGPYALSISEDQMKTCHPA